ncbi:MAG: transaldolase [Solirubrobacterales bacterium]
MKGTDALREIGQSIWLDNITRPMLDDGTEQRYIDELSVTGQTSNPTIFDKAISGGDAYDEQIAELHHKGLGGEELFFELALADINRAAKMFHPVHERTERVDGWVSVEVSPLLAYDTEKTIQQAADLHGRADENVFVKIPGTPEGLPAIEESIYAGIPINVTLLLSSDQYEAAADAFMRGIQRRIDDGLDPAVPSVASVFLSRWDVAVADQVPPELRNRLGIAVGKRSYRSYRELLGSERWQALEKAGARPQRLLFASTGTKDPDASEALYVEALAAPDTINTMPDKTLLATAELDGIGDPIPEDGGDAMKVMAEYAEAGVDTDELAVRLQKEGAQKFVDSWRELLKTIESESARLAA